jgi:hypothetical protein
VPLALTAATPVADAGVTAPAPAYAAAYSRTLAPRSGNTFDTLPSR